MGEYQDRRDIDKLYSLIWDNESNQLLLLTKDEFNKFKKELGVTHYDKVDVDIPLAKLSTDLDTLDTSLDGLLDSLEDFNGALIDFNEDNTNLDSDLTKLSENLLEFLDALGLLDVDLTEIESSLELFSAQLNGDATHEGFNTTLNTLKTYIYGGSGYDISNPSSTSLKGMLLSFQSQLNDMSSGDDILSQMLYQLKDSLGAFSGTLNQFKTYLTNEGIDITEINEGLLNIVYEIATTNNQVSTHQSTIQSVQTKIGDEDGGLIKQLNDIDAVVGDNTTGLVKQANDLSTTVGNSGSGLVKQANDLSSSVTNVKTKMGYDSIGNTSLQSQITSTNGRVTSVEGEIGDPSDSASEDTVYGKITNAQNRADNAHTRIGTTSDGASTNTVYGKIKNAQNTADNAHTKIGTSSDTAGASTVFGSINQVLDDIDEVQSDIGDVTQLSGTVVANITSTKSTAETIRDTTIPDVKSKMGYTNIPSGSSLQGQITNVQGDIGTVDVDLNNDLQSQIMELIELVKGMFPTVAELNSITDIADTKTSRNNYRAEGNYPYDLIHDTTANKYYQRQYLDTSGALGYYGEWVEVPSPYSTYFTNTKLFDVVNDHFSRIGHNHNATDVLDLTSSFVDPQVDDLLDCNQHTINSRIYSAINTPPQMEQIGTTQVIYGLSIRVYSDGLNVYLTIDGTLSGNANIPNNGNHSVIGTMTNTDYAPPYEMQSPVHSANNSSKIRVTSDGKIGFMNSASSKTYGLSCSFYYPLKSRMPSS